MTTTEWEIEIEHRFPNLTWGWQWMVGADKDGWFAAAEGMAPTEAAARRMAEAVLDQVNRLALEAP